MSLAYSRTDLVLQDQLATDTFLKGLRNQKVAYEVMNHDQQSLAEAQKLAEAQENNFKATLGHNAEIRTGRARLKEGRMKKVSSLMSFSSPPAIYRAPSVLLRNNLKC